MRGNDLQYSDFTCNKPIYRFIASSSASSSSNSILYSYVYTGMYISSNL